MEFRECSLDLNGKVALREVNVVMCGASMFISTGSMTLTDHLNTLDSLESRSLSQGVALRQIVFNVIEQALER